MSGVGTKRPKAGRIRADGAKTFGKRSYPDDTSYPPLCAVLLYAMRPFVVPVLAVTIIAGALLWW